jgi:hypothetical protein
MGMTLEESITKLSVRVPDWKRHGHFPDKVKTTFSHFGYRKLEGESINPGEFDITDLSITDEGLEISFERDDLSGVQQEISFPQQFVLEARDFLEALYTTYRQYATCRLNIYLRDKVDVNRYEHIRSFRFDFDTIKVEEDRVEITVENEDLNTYIKSSGKTKLDIPIRDKYKDGVLVETGVGETTQFQYNRLTLRQRVVFIPVAEDQVFTPAPAQQIFYPYINLSKADLTNLDTYDFRTQEIAFVTDYSNDYYFYRAEKNGTFHLSFDIQLTIWDVTFSSSVVPFFALYKNNINAVPTADNYIVRDLGRVYYTPDRTGWRFRLTFDGDINLVSGDILSIACTLINVWERPCAAEIVNLATFEFRFFDKGPTLLIDVINPEPLLNRILSKITNGRDYTGRIEWDDEGQNIRYTSRLIAAESIRQLTDANIHVSLDDFTGWLKVKGFEYYLEENEMVFVKRGRLFRRHDVILDITEGQVADLITEADKDSMFTGVDIGYKMQEYDEDVNGRYEVNGTFSYSTNYLSQSDNILELVSPFRGDNIGLELLCKRTPDDAKEAASTKSDNDIFEFLVYKLSLIPAPYYYTYDEEYTLSEGIRIYNTPLNPYFLALANLSLIGVGTDKLFFKATTNFRSALYRKYEVPDIDFYGDLIVTDRLFSPFTYDLATDSEIKLPIGVGLNGVINFQWKGKHYSGYLKKGVQNLNKGTEKQLVLLAIE